MNFWSECSGGIAAPGLVSVLKPNAPPNLWRSRYQYDGGTQSYGPVIFIPDGPLIDDVACDAAEMIGSGQEVSWSTLRYALSTFCGGNSSLPFSHASTLA